MLCARLWRVCAGLCAALVALWPYVVAGAQDVSTPTRASRHALIVGIGNYADPAIPPLRGVVHDVSNARQMAQSMGVPEANIHVLQDQAATYANIRRALQEVAGQVKDGDRLFIYFSGHGTRFAAGDASNTCRVALIPADISVKGKAPLLTPEEIGADLAPAYSKADKVFVFFDACYSGGVQVRTRALRDAQGEILTPKFTSLDTPAFCNQPSNVRTRSIGEEAQSRGAPPNNVVQLSSSRPDEISLDSPTTGGLATNAWRYCSIYADDTDGSGSLSIAEIAACVQGRIDGRLKNESNYTGQHLVVVGNKDYAPIQDKPSQLPTAGSAASSAAQTELPPRPAAAPPKVVAIRPALQPAPQQANTVISRFPLNSVVAQSDARHQVTVQQNQQALKIGRDRLEIKVRSSRGGYVYLILQSSDNESTYVLFPNALDQENRIRANEWMQLPRPSWRMRSQGPAGPNRLLVMVTDAPRDLRALQTMADGPFVKTLNDRSAAQSLSWLVGTAATYSEAKCASELVRRDLVYVEQCSDSFGAQLVEFVEQN